MQPREQLQRQDLAHTESLDTDTQVLETKTWNTPSNFIKRMAACRRTVRNE